MIIAVKSEFFGLDTNGRRVTIAHFVGDSSADLPAISDYTTSGIQITTGSTFHSVADGADYEMKSDGTWVLSQAGEATYTKSEIDAMIASVDAMRQGKEIAENGDLNDYNDAGAYYSPNSTRTASLHNRPWSGSGFKMIVWSISGTSKMQWVMPMSNSADSIFFRSRTTSGWRSWYQIKGTQIQTINP